MILAPNIYNLEDFQCIQQPKNSNWCWAACLSMVMLYFKKQNAKMCSIMSEELKPKVCCPVNLNICDKPLQVGTIFTKLNLLGLEYKWSKKKLSEDCIKHAIKKGPVIICYQDEKNKFGHVVMFTGYKEVNQKFHRVTTYDPNDGEDNYTEQSWENMHEYEAQFTWKHTFYI